MIVSPPSWRMPTSKETRVRVDGFSKIIASTLPSSGRSLAPALRRVLRARASSSIARSSAEESADRSVKWRSSMAITSGCADGGRKRLRRGADGIERDPQLLVGHIQRRQNTQHVLARRHGQQIVGAQCRVHRRVRHPALEAEQKPDPAHFLEHRRELVDHAGEALLESKRLAVDLVEESFL